jgi:hypothetical protein
VIINDLTKKAFVLFWTEIKVLGGLMGLLKGKKNTDVEMPNIDGMIQTGIARFQRHYPDMAKRVLPLPGELTASLHTEILDGIFSFCHKQTREGP